MLLHKSNKKSAARRQIDIKGVSDGVLILPRNRYRMVLQVSSLNFELKSEAEQDALIDIYRNFLNSLSGPLQLVIRIREIDMDKYLDDLRARLDGESEDVYRAQIESYSEFIASLVSTNKILTRHCYVVLECDAKADIDLDLAKEQLALSSDIVARGLARLGIQCRKLTSLQLLDMFYSFYSPLQAKTQPLTEESLDQLNRSYF